MDGVAGHWDFEQLGGLFFGKKQFNLAKRLKAAQVHDSDTPSLFSQRKIKEDSVNQMRVLAAYGLQFGRYQITHMATQKKQYDNTKGIVLDAWHGVLLATPGMAHLVGVLQSRLWVLGGRLPDIGIIVT